MTQLNYNPGANIFICGIYASKKGTVKPLFDDTFLSRFYDSVFTDEEFILLYNSLGKLSFTSESSDTLAGPVFTQKLALQIPNSGRLSAVRVAELFQIKFLLLKLTNGEFLVMGRNDFGQNSLPKVKTQSSQRFIKVEISSVSIFPVGYKYLDGTENPLPDQEDTDIDYDPVHHKIIQDTTDVFTWSGGLQEFILTKTLYKIMQVFVNGQNLLPDQQFENQNNGIKILDILEPGDKVKIDYKFSKSAL